MNRFTRGVVAVLLGVAVVVPISGCAAAARALTVVDTLDTVGSLVPDEPASLTGEITAVVGGTDGSGLRVNVTPGDGRLAVLPDGTSVTVLCDVEGPAVRDGWRSSSTWSKVRTADATTGYVSDTYLRPDPADAAPPC